MSQVDLIAALDACGVRTNATARAKLAADLEARGVTADEVVRGFRHLTERARLSGTRAASILATVLVTQVAWVEFQVKVRQADLADRVTDKPRPAWEHDAGKALRTTAQKTRHDDFESFGLMPAECEVAEWGGYAHERIVGDRCALKTVADECEWNPLQTIEAAAFWADRFGGGRAKLREALVRCVSLGLCNDVLVEHVDALEPYEAPVREPFKSPFRRPASAEFQLRIVRPMTDEEARAALDNIANENPGASHPNGSLPQPRTDRS